MTRLPPAVILAGGLATRMGGGNKGMVLLGGQSLLSRVIGRLRPQAGEIAINANGPPEALAEYGLPVIADGVGGFAGPLAGVLAAMRWAARAGAPAVLSVSVDTPFLPPDLVHRLVEAAGPRGLALAASPGPEGRLRDHPTCALWPVTLADALAEALESGQSRIGQFAAAYRPGRAVFDSDPFDPFLNINTPEDLARAEALL